MLWVVQVAVELKQLHCVAAVVLGDATKPVHRIPCGLVDLCVAVGCQRGPDVGGVLDCFRYPREAYRINLERPHQGAEGYQLTCDLGCVVEVVCRVIEVDVQRTDTGEDGAGVRVNGLAAARLDYVVLIRHVAEGVAVVNEIVQALGDGFLEA